MLPTLLAFSWHITDTVLDITDAPKKARLAVAVVGVAWSAFFLGMFMRQQWNDQNSLL